MADQTGCMVHSAAILGGSHDANKRRSWWVIALCGAMMVAEIGGGLLFGSIALVADGLHMSTHAGALLLAALAYSFASRHAGDARFTFGTGKLGDLAGFTSAIVLALIALLIGYEAVSRFFAPVPIDFREAIPIAVLGLAVNVVSVLLLSGGHHHGHGHGHSHGDDHGHEDEPKTFATEVGTLALSVFEKDHPPVFRLAATDGRLPLPGLVSIVTIRPNRDIQRFSFANHGDYLQSVEEIPEPHVFTADVRINGEDHSVDFAEDAGHAHGGALHRDNNMRAAIVHVLADAAVSVLVIAGLGLAWTFGWLWMDPAAGITGAAVIAAWSYSLIRDTGAVLLDMVPDRGIAAQVRAAVEGEGDELADFHLWRLGPGHLGAILSVVSRSGHAADFYRAKLARLQSLSHVTIEVNRM